MTVSEKNDPGAVKDRVVQATRPGNITLLSRAFGRGTDFVIGDKRVKEAGGLHVIQTFIA
jgi:preprotein translocase subunit SecA